MARWLARQTAVAVLFSTHNNQRCSWINEPLLPPLLPQCHPAAIAQLADRLLAVTAQFAEVRDYNKHTRPLGVVPTALTGEDDQEDPDDGMCRCMPSRRCRKIWNHSCSIERSTSSA